MNMKNDILFYTIGTRIMPSSRARIYIHESLLQQNNFKYKIIPAINNFLCKKRIEGKRNSPFIKLFFQINVMSRLFYFLINIPFAKIIVAQKVLFPILIIPIIKLLFKNKITYFDLDDMVYKHHHGDTATAKSSKNLTKKFKYNINLYNKIIVSTEYLKNDIKMNFNCHEDFFHIIINPIDTNHFSPKKKTYNRIPKIGWIGTPTNTEYLTQCAESINRLNNEGYRFRLFFVGAREDIIHRLFDKKNDIIFEDWTLSRENILFDQIDIGLMPLPDDEWSRTKAGYKLMLYMSMGKIGVASNVGINSDIIKHGVNGYLINTGDEWYTVLKEILDNYYNMNSIRIEARNTILNRYSQKAAGNNFISLLTSEISN
jgi:glycosyltransferase involved in cell wall biosynthesis